LARRWTCQEWRRTYLACIVEYGLFVIPKDGLILAFSTSIVFKAQGMLLAMVLLACHALQKK